MYELAAPHADRHMGDRGRSGCVLWPHGRYVDDDMNTNPNQLKNKLLLDEEDVSADDIDDQVDDLADRLIQEEKDQKVLDDRP